MNPLSCLPVISKKSVIAAGIAVLLVVSAGTFIFIHDHTRSESQAAAALAAQHDHDALEQKWAPFIRSCVQSSMYYPQVTEQMAKSYCACARHRVSDMYYDNLKLVAPARADYSRQLRDADAVLIYSESLNVKDLILSLATACKSSLEPKPTTPSQAPQPEMTLRVEPVYS